MADKERALEDFCPRCGLKISKRSAPGSITGYMFDPVRCKCATGDTIRPPEDTLAVRDRADDPFVTARLEDAALTFGAAEDEGEHGF